jgi:hypothetical protein
MCHSVGTGSRYDVATIMPNIWTVALGFLLGTAVARNQPAESNSDLEADEFGDDFAFDVVERFNAGLVANADAIDTGLTAILAGIVAVVVFSIDKLRELHQLPTSIALGTLFFATLVCIIGYRIGGSRHGLKNRDGVRPSSFLPDFARNPEEATANAIQQLVNASEANLSVRSRKRSLAMIALVLLLMGVAVLTAARLAGNMV